MTITDTSLFILPLDEFQVIFSGAVIFNETRQPIQPQQDAVT